jgi:acyl-CoA synthetase (AMP-forming)/AMP-acid ligase II
MFRFDASEGCVYFVDRLGDTFRWKSENVSTNEVSDIYGQHHHIDEVNVYGVLVPNTDGRCGCAAIVLPTDVTAANFDWEGLAAHARKMLPSYAIPVFLRVTPNLNMTGTMKVQKTKMREEGIDVERANDKFFWLPPGSSKYIEFTKKDYEDLKGGRVRL